MAEPRIKRLYRVEAIDIHDGHVRYRRDYQGSCAAWGRAHTLLSKYREWGVAHIVIVTRSEPVVFTAAPEVRGGDQA